MPSTNSPDRLFTFREVVKAAKGDAAIFYRGSVLINTNLYTEKDHGSCPCKVCQVCEDIRLSDWSGVIDQSAILQAADFFINMKTLELYNRGN